MLTKYKGENFVAYLNLYHQSLNLYEAIGILHLLAIGVINNLPYSSFSTMALILLMTPV